MGREENVFESIWVTPKRAAEVTGLPLTWFEQRTAPSSGIWPEGKVWKWYGGRKLIKLDELTAEIDRSPSVPSNRGRRHEEGQRTTIQ